ncbi:MAG: DUF1080 domain-containing protein, partial [Anaerolineae bacterium]|nr:DUF1080 domain-containing protein [Anaerolineae bacterium]
MRRLWPSTLVCIAVVVTLSVALATIAGERFIGRAEELGAIGGEVLFSDDFSGDLSQWSDPIGTWSIDNGELVGHGLGGQIDGWIYAGDALWTDYALQAEVNFVDPHAALVVRSTGHWQSECRIDFWSQDSGWIPNHIQVTKYVDGAGTYFPSGSTYLSPIPITNPAIVRVEIVDDRLEIFVNGTSVVQLTDADPYAAGRIGLGVIWSYTTRFDDVVVTSLGSSGYAVSGQVTDDEGQPFAGVGINTNQGHIATTDASGVYTLTQLITGRYMFTPTLSGYVFDPPTRTITVPPNAENQDFTAREWSCNLSKQPVLLIHGWGGEDVLAKDEKGLAQLYLWMQSDGYVEGCNLFYATGVKADNLRQENREAISESLRRAYGQLKLSNPNWQGHFDIIGHSCGGLNARFYLESKYYKADQSDGIHVDNLFTLGSPHGGAMVFEESYWGAMSIAGKHIAAPIGNIYSLKNWYDFLSAANLYRTAMDVYNFVHRQPDSVCYHLIGGDFLQQDDVPWVVRAAYSPWLNYPGDIGVSLRSSRQLGTNPLLQFSYPRVRVVANDDMHGYFKDWGLGVLTSYVYPSNTYMQKIRDYLGSRQCPTTAVNSFDVSVNGVTDGAFVAPIVLAGGTLNAGQTTTGTFPVDWTGQSVFHVTWEGGDALDFSLTDANGTSIAPTVAQGDPNIAYDVLTSANGGLA